MSIVRCSPFGEMWWRGVVLVLVILGARGAPLPKIRMPTGKAVSEEILQFKFSSIKLVSIVDNRKFTFGFLSPIITYNYFIYTPLEDNMSVIKQKILIVTFNPLAFELFT